MKSRKNQAWASEGSFPLKFQHRDALNPPTNDVWRQMQDIANAGCSPEPWCPGFLLESSHLAVSTSAWLVLATQTQGPGGHDPAWPRAAGTKTCLWSGRSQGLGGIFEEPVGGWFSWRQAFQNPGLPSYPFTAHQETMVCDRYYFFFLVFFQLYWGIIDKPIRYLKYTPWWFDIHTHCAKIPTTLQPVRRRVERVLKKIKLELPYDPAIRAYIWRKTWSKRIHAPQCSL